MSRFLDMMRDVPPDLAAAWGGWLAVGLLLMLWHLRARVREQEYALQRALARSRPKSGVRTARPVKATPVDAFGELEALLEPGPGSGSISRRPGD
ncbi:MAG: hypothetical protein Q8N52_10785 [Acidobacteriota bacterium]|nr:hypothetical protein [Acidobacteriota bacterium]MDP2390800.1 hypothetical protein [Acidobacteriota bacterium]